MSLKKARQLEPEFNAGINSEKGGVELLELGERLEDLTRNVGMHAGGVLIAPGKLTDFCPLYCAEGSDNVVSQFDKDDVEAVGLVKFDFLGLRTLTIIDWAVKYVNALEKGEGTLFSIESIPVDDKAVYDRIFKTANTTAVFQFESRGMKDTLVKASPSRAHTCRTEAR